MRVTEELTLCDTNCTCTDFWASRRIYATLQVAIILAAEILLKAQKSVRAQFAAQGVSC